MYVPLFWISQNLHFMKLWIKISKNDHHATIISAENIVHIFLRSKHNLRNAFYKNQNSIIFYMFLWTFFIFYVYSASKTVKSRKVTLKLNKLYINVYKLTYYL